MPNISYYSDVKKIKKSFKSRAKNFFIFFIFVGMVVGCIFTASALSQALTVGNINNLLVYGGTTLKIDKHNMYLLTMGEYKDKSEAEKVALGVTIQGASGYIWENEKYLVVGSAYFNSSDAEIVKSQLSGSNYNINILEVEFPKININFDEYDNKSVSRIRSAFDIIDKIIINYYDYSIKFDKGEINHLAISSAFSELRGEVKVNISHIQGLMNIKSNEYLLKIQNALIKIEEELDISILKTIDNTGTNSNLKNTMVSIIRFKYDLYNSIA